jgi:hypothetical protein
MYKYESPQIHPKLSHLPDSKSICEKYGLYLTDPVKRRKRQTNTNMKVKLQKIDGSQPKDPGIHYYNPEDIRLKTHSAQGKTKSPMLAMWKTWTHCKLMSRWKRIKKFQRKGI